MLHTAAHVVDARRGEPDRVEVIDHQRRVREHVADRGGVPAERVDGGDLDLVGPAIGLVGDPVAHDVTGTTWHDVQQSGAVDVDERGCHLGAASGVGVLERVLIHADCDGPLDSHVGGDQLVAVIDDGLMGALPADTELAGHLGHRVEVVTDPPADLGSSALGQRRSHRDQR